MSVRSASLVLALLFVAGGSAGCRGGSGGAKSQGVAREALDTEIAGPNGTKLFVPAGAVSSDTTLTITVVPSARRPPDGAAVATPIRLGPEGQTFSKPVELTLPIDPSALPVGKTAADIVVMRAPSGTDAYVPLPTRRAGSASVAVLTEHFSDFVPVVFVADASVPTGCGDRVCAGGETCSTCPFDCGLCVGANVCGNATCDANESCSACPYDCRCVSGNGCVGDFVDDAGVCGMLTTCVPGQYESIPPTTSSDRACAPCQPGSYSDVANAPSCTPCPVNTASSATGASSASTCQPCASGFEATTPGLGACTDIDECLVNNGGCAGATPFCQNQVGAAPNCLAIPATGLALWLDAGRSVFADAGTTAASNGGPVQTWRDVSGFAHDCTQTTVGAQPTFTATATPFNNLPTLHFASASSAILTCNDSITIGTVFTVVAYDTTSFSGFAGVLGHKNNGSVAILWGNGTAYGTDAPGTISLDGTASGSSMTGNTSITAPTLLTVVEPTPVVYATWVGRADGVGATWNGQIAEIIAYDSALDAASIRAVECYLGTKYAITLGHSCP